MRKILLATAVALLTFLSLRVLAATPSEFHASLLRRGITAYEGGRYQEAAKSLRLAAFGFVDAIEQYQTAHAYLALSYDQLKDAERTRESLRRIVQAERVERKFGTIAFPPSVRSAFNALAAKMLTAGEVEMLKARASGAPAATPADPAASAPPVAKPQASATTTTTTPTRTSGGETPPQQPAKTPAVPKNTKPAAPPPATTAPKPAPAPAPAPPPAQPPAVSATEVANRLASAERALTTSNLTEARRIYRELLGVNGLAHETLVRVAEGLYRARDFQGTLTAFDRAGGVRRGEEPYRYYIAVAAYETGQYERARRELASALPFIEVTPDVARYRAKIEGTQN